MGPALLELLLTSLLELEDSLLTLLDELLELLAGGGVDEEEPPPQAESSSEAQAAISHTDREEPGRIDTDM